MGSSGKRRVHGDILYYIMKGKHLSNKNKSRNININNEENITKPTSIFIALNILLMLFSLLSSPIWFPLSIILLPKFMSLEIIAFSILIFFIGNIIFIYIMSISFNHNNNIDDCDDNYESDEDYDSDDSDNTEFFNYNLNYDNEYNKNNKKKNINKM